MGLSLLLIPGSSAAPGAHRAQGQSQQSWKHHSQLVLLCYSDLAGGEQQQIALREWLCCC